MRDLEDDERKEVNLYYNDLQGTIVTLTDTTNLRE